MWLIILNHVRLLGLISCYSLYNIVENIVYQKNLYANQKGKHWSPFTEQELFRFAGITFVMGCHKLPSWTHYWKNDRDLSVQVVSETMPRNRSASIL